MRSMTVSTQHLALAAGCLGWERMSQEKSQGLLPTLALLLWKQTIVREDVWLGTKPRAMPTRSDLPRGHPTELHWSLSAPRSKAREFGQSAVSNTGGESCACEHRDSKRAATAAPLPQQSLMQRNCTGFEAGTGGKAAQSRC